MKEISKKVILEVTLFNVHGFRRGSDYDDDEEHKYVYSFIDKNHRDKILILRHLDDRVSDVIHNYYKNMTDLQIYKVAVDNFVDAIYILIKDILQPDSEEKKIREINIAYGKHFERMLFGDFLKNPELVTEEEVDKIRNRIKEINNGTTRRG